MRNNRFGWQGISMAGVVLLFIPALMFPEFPTRFFFPSHFHSVFLAMHVPFSMSLSFLLYFICLAHYQRRAMVRRFGQPDCIYAHASPHSLRSNASRTEFSLSMLLFSFYFFVSSELG
jgi:hypothetical protein